MTRTLALFRCVESDTLFRVRSESSKVYLDQYDGSGYNMLYEIRVSGIINRYRRCVEESRELAESHTGGDVFRLEETSESKVESFFEEVA